MAELEDGAAVVAAVVVKRKPAMAAVEIAEEAAVLEMVGNLLVVGRVVGVEFEEHKAVDIHLSEADMDCNQPAEVEVGAVPPAAVVGSAAVAAFAAMKDFVDLRTHNSHTKQTAQEADGVPSVLSVRSTIEGCRLQVAVRVALQLQLPNTQNNRPEQVGVEAVLVEAVAGEVYTAEQLQRGFCS